MTACIRRGAVLVSLPACVWHAAVVVLLAQQARPTFRAGVEYVVVDVVVTDRNDRPVTDLTIEDFEILERGRPQAVADFDFVSVPPARRLLDLSTPARPTLDIAANQPPSDTSRAFAFVIDDGGISASDLVPLKRTLMSMLAAASAGDQIAVVYMQRSDLSQDFTNDVGLLTNAIQQST
jgi:VWFA-related protein